MRSLTPIVVGLYLSTAAVAACSSSSSGSGSPAPTPDAGPAASNSGAKPAPLPSASNGGSNTTKPDAGGQGTVKKPTTCRGAAECLAACGDDDKCTDNCFGGMNDAELKKLQAVSICIGESGCSDDACVQEVCATEIATCLAQ
jgi:hypothetical protein